MCGLESGGVETAADVAGKYLGRDPTAEIEAIIFREKFLGLGDVSREDNGLSFSLSDYLFKCQIYPSNPCMTGDYYSEKLATK